MDLTDLSIRALPAAHFPVIRGCMDALGFQEVFDDHLPKHPLAHVSDGECLMAMVLNIMSGRVSLWRMDQWLGKLDVELLLGEGIEAGWFNDTRLGVALDRMDEVGTDTLLSVVVARYLNTQESPTSHSVHLDTTTLSVYGEYNTEEAPVPTFGYSKAKRPDLKQLVFGLSIHGSVGIPLTMSMTDGNTSEQASNRDHLSRLAKLLPDPTEVTIVADCKVVDATTMGQLLRSGFHIVSLVPENFSVRAELVDKAWKLEPNAQAWPLLAERAGPTKADPPQRYRGLSFRGKMNVHLGEDPTANPIESDEDLRFLVVHSDRLAAHFEKSLPDKLRREKAAVEKRRNNGVAKVFACEPDAREAGERLIKKLALHAGTVVLYSEERTKKRTKRGRPTKDEEPVMETVWTFSIDLQADQVAIQQARQRSSCFLLVSDWAEEEWDDQRVLGEYRHQALIEGHTGFRWLKGPAAAAPVMLNTPTRIRALGLVFVLALMIRNYIQFTIRAGMTDRKSGVKHPFRGREDSRLTTEMALEWFGGLITTFAKLPNTDWHRRPPQLSAEAQDLLGLLDMKPAIYARPPTRQRSWGSGK